MKPGEFDNIAKNINENAAPVAEKRVLEHDDLTRAIGDIRCVANTGPSTVFGRCRRHAPSMNGYPAVFGHDWCGDHKLDENRVASSNAGDDPWAHRTAGMRCATCMWFAEKVRG